MLHTHTQLEVSVQDPSAVDVLEAGYDLSQVISHFWLRECVSRLPNVRQGLRGQSNEPLTPASISGTEQHCHTHTQ